MNSPNLWQSAQQWLTGSSERALEQAYQAALAIKAIEDEHFQGKPVAPKNSSYSASAYVYFRAEVVRNRQLALNKLADFRRLRSLPWSKQPAGNNSELTTRILRQLSYIDEVIGRYEAIVEPLANSSAIASSRELAPAEPTARPAVVVSPDVKKTERNRPAVELETVTDKTAVLPRSFLRTFNRIKQEIDPNAETNEEQVIRKFRTSRNKTTIAIKFFLVLIVVPLLTHQLSKALIVAPLVEQAFANPAEVSFLNRDLEVEALEELDRFRNRLELQNLLDPDKFGPHRTDDEITRAVQHRADEVADEYRQAGLNAIENVFADLFSLVAFAVVIFFSQPEIAVVKSFIDEIVYGLSDSAKAFLIILLTDIFVGYHSPHGWEIILEGISRHFGLPENREFNFLFIATFPVILDTVLKYWIFRYLNRISPSAVATYRNMNE
ncbi:MAG: proton extrusion protein PcxA [Cyanobacteria bacterium P01_H01_bin.15]